MDVTAVIDNCSHLSPERQADLKELLLRFPKLFDGVLRKYPHEKIHLDVDPNVPPRATRAYSVPATQLELFKYELDRLIATGVLEEGTRSRWISGTFIVPKKQVQGVSRARWVSDFRALNTAIRRKVYPIPRIQDILLRRKNYNFCSKIDLSMMFYTFELDDESKDLTTIATPFGLYRYKRLPMGVSQSPDVAQELIEKTLRGIPDVEAYIDDIAVFSKDWSEHLNTLSQVFQRLTDNGFAVNPMKCDWAVRETDFLGHYLTPTGVKPWAKKVQAIVDMKEPTNITELRAFIGLSNYYRDMWPRRAHILAPLSSLTGAKVFTWLPQHSQAFKQWKAMVTADALLAYPDHNLPFDIETDASDFQLGAIIKQNGRPVAYFSKKLNDAQRNYTTIEKELLSVVETLREFRSMLLGAKLTIHTDHKNLTHSLSQFTTQRVLRWRLLLEEFGPTFIYKPGPDNVVADAISRLPTSASFVAHDFDAQFVSSSEHTPADSSYFPGQPIHEVFASIALDASPKLVQTLSHHPGIDCYFETPIFDTNRPLRSPVSFADIREYQLIDDPLKQRASMHPQLYQSRSLGGVDVLTFRYNPSQQWRVALPTNMLTNIVKWYHKLTAHTEAAERLHTTISKVFYHPTLRQACHDECDPCQICARMKKGQRQYSQLAPRQAVLAPWSEVHVDSIGPWKIRVNGIDLKFQALTCLDPVFNLIEIAPKSNNTAAEMTEVFKQCWLSRYPRPDRCVHDNGPEFKAEFQDLLLLAGIKPVPISAHSPTSNSLIEATHKAIGQVVRTMVAMRPPTTKSEADALVKTAFSTAMHAARCASNSSLGASPGALAFGRDMNLNIPLLTDLHTLHSIRQLKIDERLLAANRSRISFDYKVDDRVYLRVNYKASEKAKPIYRGPYKIIRVHTNNTVTLQLSPGVTDRFNIRRIKPQYTR